MMPNLHAIVYVSSATRQLTEADIGHLLNRARERNQQHDVTGVLLFCHGNFMQYIEGPQASLQTIYDIIRADPMHQQLIELFNEPIASRAMQGWSMAYRVMDKASFAPVSLAIAT